MARKKQDPQPQPEPKPENVPEAPPASPKAKRNSSTLTPGIAADRLLAVDAEHEGMMARAELRITEALGARREAIIARVPEELRGQMWSMFDAGASAREKHADTVPPPAGDDPEYTEVEDSAEKAAE